MRRDSSSRQGTIAVDDSADGQIDLSNLARALWRRRRWIVIPTILAGIAAAVFVTLATPQYRSQALVLIENRETAYNRPEGADRTAERQRPDPEAVASEVQLALSRDLARSVVRDLKLGERAEFNPEAGVSPVSALLRLIGLARDPSRMTFEERVLERYYERLSVYQVEKSRVIGISFHSENPLAGPSPSAAQRADAALPWRAPEYRPCRQSGQSPLRAGSSPCSRRKSHWGGAP
jgi:uncharacterized protein involved in exopolysaccharide biosynthesis